jgi:hypothetical protein
MAILQHRMVQQAKNSHQMRQIQARLKMDQEEICGGEIADGYDLVFRRARSQESKN